MTHSPSPDLASRARAAFLGLALGDIETGECQDGLMPTGVNRNRGAESILAFHFATVAIQHHRGSEC